MKNLFGIDDVNILKQTLRRLECIQEEVELEVERYREEFGNEDWGFTPPLQEQMKDINSFLSVQEITEEVRGLKSILGKILLISSEEEA